MAHRIFYLLLLCQVACFVHADERPNLLLIYADDLGWKDPSYQGNEYYETPNIDQLAQRSMNFSQAYAGAGNCAPSRACLLSGTYTPRHGVYAVDNTARGPKQCQRLIPTPNKSGLAPAEVTLAESLKSAGYTTGIFGKWHLDGKDGASPGQQGFDMVYDPQGGKLKPQGRNNNDPKGVFSLTQHAVDFIKSAKANQQPFFAYVSHHAIHAALESRADSLKKFQAKTAGKQDLKPIYAACLFDFDAAVGELLTQLKTLGLTENTLVIFTSDNGGTQQSSQEPLRGNKGSYYEGGIRIPFLASWPGVIKPGKSELPIHQIDLYPTFLAAAGIKKIEGIILDGENLLPILKGAADASERSLFWYFPGYLDTPVIRGRSRDVKLGFRSCPVSVIRDGEWKLHLFHEEWQLDGGLNSLSKNSAVELYRLSSDPGEKTNLAAQEPQKTLLLIKKLLAWQQSCKVTMPAVANPDYHASVVAKKMAVKR